MKNSFYIFILLFSFSLLANPRKALLTEKKHQTSQTVIFLKNLLVDRKTKAPSHLSDQLANMIRNEDQADLLRNIDFYENQLKTINEYLLKN